MKTSPSARLLAFLSILTLAIVGNAMAQLTEAGLAARLPSASAAAYYYVAKPGELTMTVNVWGYVKNPGRYEVSSSTDLVSLLSFAGGPVQYAKLDDVKLTRTFKTDTGVNKVEYSINLEELEKRTEAELELRPGDTIFLNHTSWLTVRDAFSVITTVAVITGAISQFLWAIRR